jgi:hypothetical protein
VKVNDRTDLHPGGIVELVRVSAVIGLTAFGPAVLQSVRSAPVKRGWLQRGDVDEGRRSGGQPGHDGT